MVIVIIIVICIIIAALIGYVFFYKKDDKKDNKKKNNKKDKKLVDKLLDNNKGLNNWISNKNNSKANNTINNIKKTNTKEDELCSNLSEQDKKDPIKILQCSTENNKETFVNMPKTNYMTNLVVDAYNNDHLFYLERFYTPDKPYEGFTNSNSKSNEKEKEDKDSKVEVVDYSEEEEIEINLEKYISKEEILKSMNNNFFIPINFFNIIDICFSQIRNIFGNYLDNDKNKENIMNDYHIGFGKNTNKCVKNDNEEYNIDNLKEASNFSRYNFFKTITGYINYDIIYSLYTNEDFAKDISQYNIDHDDLMIEFKKSLNKISNEFYTSDKINKIKNCLEGNENNKKDYEYLNVENTEELKKFKEDYYKNIKETNLNDRCDNDGSFYDFQLSILNSLKLAFNTHKLTVNNNPLCISDEDSKKIILYLVTLILEINKLMMKFDKRGSMEIINKEQIIDNKNIELPYHVNFEIAKNKNINIRLINYNNPKDLFDHELNASDLNKDNIGTEIWQHLKLNDTEITDDVKNNLKHILSLTEDDISKHYNFFYGNRFIRDLLSQVFSDKNNFDKCKK